MSVQNEKLIEEAAKAIRDVREVVVPRGDGYVSVTDADDATLARAAFAVFEKAHAHECEMCRWENGFGARKPLTHTCEKNLSTDDFPHGHPEMDPTDDEVEALRIAHLDARQAAYRKEREDWFVDHEAEPEIATNAFFRGWDAAVGGGFRRSEVVPEPSAREDEFTPGECDGSGKCPAEMHVHGCYMPHRADQCDSLDEYGHLPAEPQGEPSDAQVNRDYLAQVIHKAVYSRIPLDDLTDEAHTTTPPDGWFYMGSHVGAPWLNLEFSEEMDETGLPLWERPVQHTPTKDEREALRIAHLDARQAAYRKEREDWFVDHEAEPEIATNAFFRGWDAAVGGGFRRSEVVPEPSAEVVELRKQIEKLDADLGQQIDRTEELHDIADRLSWAIAPMSEIGEHSSANDPWENAIEYAASRQWCGGIHICSNAEHDHQEPQGEPSDATVEAGCVAFYEGAQGLTSWARLVSAEPDLANRYRDGMRAALRAAGVGGAQ